MTNNRYAKRSNFDSPIRTPLLRQHFVYRAFDEAGDLLYVGCTYGVEKRLKEHRMGRWHHLMTSLRIAGPYNYETARLLEHAAIESERPQFNYTSDHRKIDKIRSRMIGREMDHLASAGGDIYATIAPACEIVDSLLPEPRNQRMTDLSVPAARRIEAEHAARLERAA